MPDWVFTLGWVVILGALGVWELWAILRKKRGDTLSEHTWWLLRKSPVIWFVALGFFGWLIVHFFAFGAFDRWLW